MASAAIVFEAQILQALQAQFNAQREEALRNFDPSRIGKSYTRKDYLNDLVDWLQAAEAMRGAIEPIIYAALVETGREAMSEVGKQPSQFNPFTEPIRDFYTSRSVKIAKDVDDETEKQLRATLSKGVAAGESTTELRARIESVMGTASTIRADRIARTEVSRVQGYSNIEAWTQSGVVSAKEWFTAEDERVCPFCNDLDGKTTGLSDNFFDKGDTLSVGGKSLSLDYDDIPSAPLHANCRCVLLPVRS